MTIPIGVIIMWFDDIENAPSGWQICDGTNGTPDLRGCFIYGADEDTDVDDTGGTSTHKHTNSDTASGGSHSHHASGNTGGPGGSVSILAGGSDVAGASHTHAFSFTTSSEGAHTHSVPDTSSSSTYPAYVKMYYIMKLS